MGEKISGKIGGKIGGKSRGKSVGKSVKISGWNIIFEVLVPLPFQKYSIC